MVNYIRLGTAAFALAFLSTPAQAHTPEYDKLDRLVNVVCADDVEQVTYFRSTLDYVGNSMIPARIQSSDYKNKKREELLFDRKGNVTVIISGLSDLIADQIYNCGKSSCSTLDGQEKKSRADVESFAFRAFEALRMAEMRNGKKHY